jgi:hypothetical protein
LALKSKPPKPLFRGFQLSCDPNSWAGDLVESFVYRRPLSVALEWIDGDSPIPGEGAATYRTAAVGIYRCRVSAENQAGAASTLSLPAGVFAAKRRKPSRRRGALRLRMIVPGHGNVRVSGRGLVPKRASIGGSKTLLVKARGKVRRRLRHGRKVYIRMRVAFALDGGVETTQQQAFLLRSRRARR